MTKFLQTVAVYVNVIVEAPDEYAADRLISGMNFDEIMAAKTGRVEIDGDYTDNFPEEI